MAPLQFTFKFLRHATLSRIPRKNEGLLQARKASANFKIIGGFRIPRPSPRTQKQKATSVQKKNTMIIKGITNRYDRIRRERRL
jgi:hypothetical protein